MKAPRKKLWLIAVILMMIATAGAAYSVHREKPATIQKSQFRVSIVERGDITQTVTATGTINPVALVNVGSQVSGTVFELNADFNDRVKKGQVLLRLDPTIFHAQVRQYEAGRDAAYASLRLAEASFTRNHELVGENFISNAMLDQSRRELEVARANVRVAESQVARAQADLDNSVIRSPIDGVVIKRSVDRGQTLAATFATPNLFQIAQDLTKMQIDTNVSEADIGALRVGQPARFIVDAYPEREFAGTMRQFRLAPNVVQNLVTYNVVLDVENKDQLLKPGMTAQVRLVVGSRKNVLRVPTAALRFRLSNDYQENQVERSKYLAANGPVEPNRNSDDDGTSFRTKAEAAREFQLYRLGPANEAVPLDVTVGLSNFRYTEILSGPLKSGDQVIIRTLIAKGLTE